jgi:hypothetical protein
MTAQGESLTIFIELPDDFLAVMPQVQFLARTYETFELADLAIALRGRILAPHGDQEALRPYLVDLWWTALHGC